eukprot:5073247-Amphidinium_carterae.1
MAISKTLQARPYLPCTHIGSERREFEKAHNCASAVRTGSRMCHKEDGLHEAKQYPATASDFPQVWSSSKDFSQPCSNLSNSSCMRLTTFVKLSRAALPDPVLNTRLISPTTAG